jgi:2-dehydro-3-deoxyphosphogluconate aldolase / (4S)-4-hydroxy-2-oxoglutarate aldolase
MTGVHPVIATLARDRLLPVIRLDNPGDAPALGAALRAGGLGCAEVTFRTEAAPEAIAALAATTDLLVGAGTVIRAEQVETAVEAGARFIVSPGLSAAVVARAVELDTPVVPGVATSSEVMAALDLGISVVKFFPAEQLGGVATMRALAGPFGGVRFIPTGGIDAALLPRYLAEPSVLAVGGSWMVDRALLAARDWDTVTGRTAAALRMARAEAT